MVFNDGDPTFSISSILSRYDPSVLSTTGASTTVASRPTPSRINSERKSSIVTRPNGTPASKSTTSATTTLSATTLSRPSISGPKPTTTSSYSRNSTTSAVTSSKTDAGAIAKKRKIEESAQSLVEKQRAALLAKAKKPTSTTATGTNKPTLSKISTTGSRPGTMSTGNTSAEAPKKVGYKELLARAAQAQAEKKTAPGTITHKARPQIKEQKAWQKKLEEQKAGKIGGANGTERSSKSPGVASGGEKGNAVGKKASEPVKAVAGKKGVGGAVAGGADSRRSSLGNTGVTVKGKVADKPGRNGPADMGTKRKRDSSPRGGYGGSGRSGNGYSLPKKNTSRRYDTYEEEDEDDDFVVDDEDDVPSRGRPYGGGGGGASGRYTYYESDYDSGSDMEAAGIDVLEEEERSRRAADLEDQAQERLEKEMAARKAALKKKLAGKKK